MNTATKKFSGNRADPSLESLPEADFPERLHGQIMKRVFFAGYGRYLYLSSGVLFLNLGVLGRELWRTAMEMNLPSVETSAFFKGFALLPTHVFVALAVTTIATVYAFHMIWKLHREYRVFVFAK